MDRELPSYPPNPIAGAVAAQRIAATVIPAGLAVLAVLLLRHRAPGLRVAGLLGGR